MEKIVVSLTSSDDRIQYKLHISKKFTKYFLKDTMFVEYDNSIDISNISKSILMIPLVSVVAPIAWATGAEVYVSELDANYLESLKKVKEAFLNINYPFLPLSNIKAERKVTNEFGRKRTGLLYSGGVDSLTSYLKHKQEKPDMISIWGVPDIPLSERKFWNAVYGNIATLAHQDGLKSFQIKTNVFMNINNELLKKEFGLWWFPLVQSGLTLNSLCAPITASRDINTIIRASSYTKEHESGGGTHPSIDNNTSWADVKVAHDCFELSRQEKLRYLCHEENRHYLSHLQVCNDTSRAQPINCGRCEKCLRTIAGLLVEGVDPRICNLNMDEETLTYAKECFEKGKVTMGSGTMFMWRDIQKHIPKEIDVDILSSKDFLKWLSVYDFSRHKVNRLQHYLWRTIILLRGGRLKPFYLKRKTKCYWYIVLSRLKLI